jgi:hypothetical protein
MTFLKPAQVDTKMLDEDNALTYSLNSAVIHSVCNLDDDLVKSIKDSLVEDDEVQDHLPYL